MCFAPPPRANFQHLNFQKCSEPGVLCTFWLGNVLRATAACTFSTFQLPKVLRRWSVFSILTWKCASSLISPDGSAPAALASLLFNPPEPQIIGKTQCFATFLHLLSSDSFSSLSFFLLLFSSLTLPTSAFPSVHIVGSLASKLPSIIYPTHPSKCGIVRVVAQMALQNWPPLYVYYTIYICIHTVFYVLQDWFCTVWHP